MIDPTFNTLVEMMAPKRFTYTSGQYADYAAMRDDYHARGFIAINTEFSDNTIFANPVTNWQFRAWHDICHIIADAPFTQDGERAAATIQMQQIDALDAPTESKERWKALVDAEVNGQVEYYLQHSEFPANQVECAREFLAKHYPHIAI